MSRKLDSSPARREVSSIGRAEGDGAGGADLTVDLVAHHHFEAQAFGEMVNPLGAGESGARRLDADRGGRLAEHFARDVGGGRHRFVGDERHVEPFSTSQRRPSTSSAGHSSSAKSRSRSAISCMARNDSDARPAAVAVDVQLDRVAEALPQRAHDRGVQRDRPAAHLHLERGDAVGVPHPLRLGDHLRPVGEAEHVADPHPVGVSAEQAADGKFERAAQRIPDRHVDRGFGRRVADGAGQPGGDDLALGQRQTRPSAGAKICSITAMMPACVSP